jgi:putative FmdB family regulatory protein
MPLYDYRCHGCGKVFEVKQKFADEPLKVHEECGGELERLISPPAFQFKGSGWYVTDYGRNGSSSPSNGSDNSDKKSESKSESKSSSDTKSESKPAPATPATDK